jgi:hypothetical protein
MEQIIKDFEAFFGKYGKWYSEFYVGIAADPVDTLFNRHGVDKLTDAWIHSTTSVTSSAVRATEKLFLSRGARGGPGGGDTATCYIYAYRIAPHTRQ